MSKFEFTVKSYLSTLEELIEHWFQKHFSHVTPGTPEHAVLTAAKQGLKADLGLPVAVPTLPPTPQPAVSEPAAQPIPAVASEINAEPSPAPEAESAPAETVASEPEPQTEPAA